MSIKHTKSNKFVLYILCFAIPYIFSFISLIANGFAPFGDKIILSTSKSLDVVSYYFELYDKIHTNTLSPYSNDLGLGYDFFSLISYKLSDPTNLIILLFPRNSIISVLNVLYTLKIGISGLCFCIYLNTHKKIYDNKEYITFDWSNLLFSVTYALSTTMISIGMNIAYLSAIALFPLVISGIEKLIIKNDSKCFIIFMSISILLNIHIASIAFIFCVLFFISRKYKDINSFLSSLFLFIKSCLIILLISSFIIINAVHGELYKSEISLYFPNLNLQHPWNYLKQLLPKMPLSICTESGYNTDIAFGILFIFVLFIFICIKFKHITTITRDIILFIVLLCGTFISTFKYLFNGMYYSYENEIHFGFILVFMGLFIANECIHCIDTYKLTHVLIATTSTFAYIIVCLLLANNIDDIDPFISSIKYLFAYAIAFTIFTSKKISKTIFLIGITIISIFETGSSYLSNVKIASNYINTNTLESNTNYQIYETSKKILSNNPNARILYYDSTRSKSNPFTDSLMGYDYILSTNDINELDGVYSESDEYSTFFIKAYKNIYSVHGAYFNSDIESYTYNQNNPFVSANLFSEQFMNCLPIFEEADFDVEQKQSNNNHSMSFNVTRNCSDDIYFSAYFINHFSKTNDTKSQLFTQFIPKEIGFSDQSMCYAAILINDNFHQLIDSIKCNNDHSLSLLNHKYTINSKYDGYIVADFPNNNSLIITLNNNTIKPKSFINNRLLIPVNKGANTIEIKYNNCYVFLGAILSIIGIALFFVSNKIYKKSITFYNSKIYKNIVYNINENFVYYAAIMICIALLILTQILASDMPFGPRILISGDSVLQRYTGWAEYIREIKSNTTLPSFSFNTGGFVNYHARNMTLMLHPWNYIIFKSLPENMYLAYFHIEPVLDFLMASISIIFYLTHRFHNRFNKKDKRLIAISLLYSLSAYTIVLFSYSAFKYMAYLPLIILGLEHVVYKKKYPLYVIILSLIMLDNIYQAFLVCEFLVLYFFTFEFSDIKDFISKGIRFAISSIAAAGLIAFNLLSFGMLVSNSSYQSSDSVKPSISKWYTSFIDIISEYYNSNIVKSVSNDSTQIASYCGLIMIFVIPLYIMNRHNSHKNRVLLPFLVFLYFVSINNELLNYVFHGFHYQSLVPNRFAAFIIFIFITMLSDIVYHSKEYLNKMTVCNICAISVFMICIYLIKLEKSYTVVISFIILLSCSIASIYCLIKKKDIIKYLLYISIIDILINAIVLMPNNMGGNASPIITAKEINTVSDYNKDMKKIDVITEILGGNVKTNNVARISDINTLSYFSAEHGQFTSNMLKTYNIYCGMNSTNYNTGNPLGDMMLHLKYQLLDINNATTNSIYNQKNIINNYVVYENPYYLPLGFVISSAKSKQVSPSNYSSAFDYQNDFSKNIGGKEIYNRIDCSLYNEDKNSNSSWYICDEPYASKEGNGTTKYYIPTMIHLDDSINGYIYANIENSITYIGQVGNTDHELYYNLPIDTPRNAYNLDIAVFNSDNFNELHTILSKNVMENITKDGNSVCGNINTSNNGMLYISLPYDEGWTIYIDNKSYKPEPFLGCMGTSISKGVHSIRIEYTDPAAREGIIVTISTILIIFLYTYLTYRKKNSKK